MSIKQHWKNTRNLVVAGATFWKTEVENRGIRLSLDGASPRVRFSLLEGYEVEDARLCLKYLQPDDRVLELGSSIGFIALYCLKHIGVSNFAMVEANPALRPIMEKNFALNNVEIPTYLNVAAGEKNGETTLNVSNDYFASSLNAVVDPAGLVTVPIMTLPTIIDRLEFIPNVLIMDIEGAETQIPVGHLARFDKIIVEFHRRFVGDAAIDAIIDGLRVHGFALKESDGYSSAFIRAGG